MNNKITDEIWVRVDSNKNILFEGPYNDALTYNEGHFMTKRFYLQYKEEFSNMLNKL